MIIYICVCIYVRNRHRRVKFGNADKLENRVFFRRRDRPIDISRNLRRINGNMHYNYTKKSVIKGIIKKDISFGSKKVITIEEENSPKSGMILNVHCNFNSSKVNSIYY